MSNIHTFSEIKERTENTRPLPSSWADSSQVPLDRDYEGYGEPSTRVAAGYIDMNGELQTAPQGTACQTVLYSCAPCCVDPCGEQRRGEYLKSLKSFSVPLALLQILLFIVSLCLHGFTAPSVNPMLGPPVTSLLTLGAKQGYLIQKGAVWRFLTPMLLHAGIIHLLMNMLCQWRFGLFLERRWGTPKFAAVYLAAGLGATLLSCLWTPNRISVGASGALMGIMGAFIADIILNWNNLQRTQRKLLLGQTLFWVTIALLLGISPLVDTGAHLGGLIVGLGVGFMVHSNIPKTQPHRIISLAIPAILLSIFFLVGLICFWTVVKCAVFPPMP